MQYVCKCTYSRVRVWQLETWITFLKPFCAQICTSERFVFKDAQKCTICAFIKIIKIHEFGVLKYVFRIVNMQLGPWDNMFKTICAQNCTRARFAFKDAQKWTICAFIKINQIYESFGVEFAYRILNMQLEPRIRCLKPFVHRFALVHVLRSKMCKSEWFVHLLKSTRLMSFEW